MQKKIIKGFTLIELLVVIAILGIFTVVAYPNISKWITDREVKSETYKFVGEINSMKAKVTSGEYALGMIHFTTPNFQNANIKKYFMSTEDFVFNYSGGNATWPYCDYNTGNQRYQSDGAVTSETIRHWPNVHMCVSKNGTKKGVLNQKNPDTGQARSLSRVIFCSVSNSSTSGSKRCNDSNKIDNRYMVTWDQFINLKVYKYNLKKDKWCNGNQCRSYSEFN